MISVSQSGDALNDESVPKRCGRFTASSTVILPDACPESRGKTAAMDLRFVVSQIDRRLKKLVMSANAASEQAGHKDAIRNLKRRAKQNPRGAYHAKTMEDLAPVLRTTIEWLTKGEGPEDIDPEAGPRMDVVGRVGASAQGHFFPEPRGQLGWIDWPALEPNSVAVQIDGDSLGAPFNRWYAIYDQRHDRVGAEMIGKLCIVGLGNDAIAIKMVRAVRSDGRCDLIGATGRKEDNIDYAAVEWAAVVRMMVPR